MLRLIDLANRPDFIVGSLRVSPSRRLLQGPASDASVEPIVMKVLLMLLDARGAVVTRDEIFANAWGGVMVGDDSLNQAIARTRKRLADIAPGAFEIETIPRTGYRLIGNFQGEENPAPEAALRNDGFTRRALLGTGAGAVVATGAAGGFWLLDSRERRRFRDLLKRGEDGLEYGDGSAEPVSYLRQAVSLRPRDSAAQGLYSFALVTNAISVTRPFSADVSDAEEAARASLRVDPADPHAHLALIELQRATLDLAATEERLRRVLASAPDDIFAMRLLWNLLQSAGRSRDALALVQDAIRVRPLAAGNNFPFAQLLWIVGRTAEADRVIDRAMEYWPTHRVVRFARFVIFAFTGRARSALTMLENEQTRPQLFTPASVVLWRNSLKALDDPSPTNVAKTRAENLNAVKSDVRLAWQASMTLSALGQLDAAFDVANALLLFSVPAGSNPNRQRLEPRANSVAWRFTPWLFTPATASLRADPRFQALADGVGLTTYWRARNVRPDYQVFG